MSHQLTLAQLRHRLLKKEVSSTELTIHFLDRIKKFNPDLNCFITITEEEALSQAREADRRLQAGESDWLLGLPMAHKDIFCTDGTRTTCGAKMLSNFVAPYNATIVEKIAQAGAISLGKLNMDEFAMGSSNENSYFGPVKNPWDIERVPGGSSGGSSAATAARLVPFATASDTGGSIRQPAALCNMTGLKPTYGRVSRYGMIAFASSLDQAGPITQTAEDAALVLNAMAGYDPKDSTSATLSVPDYTKTLNDSIQGLTIGLPAQFFNADLDAQIARVLDQVIKEYEKLGVIFKEIQLPHVSHGIAVYYIVAPAECSSNLARFDGIRFGYQCENPTDLDDLYRRSRSESFGKEVKRRILTGTYVLSAGYYDAYYVKAQKMRDLIRHDYQEAFKTVDLVLSPTTPSPAFRLGERNQDPISMYYSDVFTTTTNLAGLPGLAVPGGFVDQLPIGFQLTGNYFLEAQLLNVAHQYQQVTDWHKKIPKTFE